jgi:hypothetical protein
VVNQRVQLSCQDPTTTPDDGGVLVLDDTGEPTDGPATDHVVASISGLVGKVGNAIAIHNLG